MVKKPKVGMWSGLTAVTAVLTAGAIVGTTVAFHYTTTVNNYLDAETYKIIKGDSDEALSTSRAISPLMKSASPMRLSCAHRLKPKAQPC